MARVLSYPEILFEYISNMPPLAFERLTPDVN